VSGVIPGGIEFACTREVILQKGKKGNLERDLAIYLSREMAGESGIALGRYFGISGAGVTVRHSIIAEKIQKNRKLKELINRIKKAIINNEDAAPVPFFKFRDFLIIFNLGHQELLA